MKDRLHYTYISFRIASAIYLALIFVIPWLMQMDGEEMPGVYHIVMTAVILGICIGIPILTEVIIWQLKKHKLWAWIVAICMAAIYLMSAFLPLGALALWGLLDSNSQRLFGVGRASKPPLPPTHKAE